MILPSRFAVMHGPLQLIWHIINTPLVAFQSRFYFFHAWNLQLFVPTFDEMLAWLANSIKHRTSWTLTHCILAPNRAWTINLFLKEREMIKLRQTVFSVWCVGLFWTKKSLDSVLLLDVQTMSHDFPRFIIFLSKNCHIFA